MRANQFIEAAIGTNPKRPARPGSRPDRGHEPQKRYVTDRKTGKQYDPDEEFDKTMNSPEVKAQMKRMAAKEGQGISKDKETKFHAKLDKLVHNTFGKRDDEIEEIAGAFPSPSTREKWAKDAAASNAAEAKRQERLKAQQLQQNTELVDKEQKVNHHSLSPSTTPPIPVQEARQSAQVKLQKAFEREQAKSAASRKRGEEVMAQAKADVEKKSKEQKVSEGIDMQAATVKAKQLLSQGLSEQQVAEQLVKQGIPLRYAQQAVQAAQINEMSSTLAEMEKELAERGKASRQLCKSSTPDEDLGASQLASCKSQGLRARDGEKSHKLGKTAKSRVKVGGHRIKGHKYGGPLPDWS